MQVRSFFENYWEYKEQLVFIEREIKLLREQIDPSYTQVLSLMPIVHSNGSSTERTAIMHIEDCDILILVKEKKLVEANIEVVDRLIPLLAHEKKEIIEKHYIKKISIAEIADQMSMDESTVRRKMNGVFAQWDMLSGNRIQHVPGEAASRTWIVENM